MTKDGPPPHAVILIYGDYAQVSIEGVARKIRLPFPPKAKSTSTKLRPSCRMIDQYLKTQESHGLLE